MIEVKLKRRRRGNEVRWWTRARLVEELYHRVDFTSLRRCRVLTLYTYSNLILRLLYLYFLLKYLDYGKLYEIYSGRVFQCHPLL